MVFDDAPIKDKLEARLQELGKMFGAEFIRHLSQFKNKPCFQRMFQAVVEERPVKDITLGFLKEYTDGVAAGSFLPAEAEKASSNFRSYRGMLQFVSPDALEALAVVTIGDGQRKNLEVTAIPRIGNFAQMLLERAQYISDRAWVEQSTEKKNFFEDKENPAAAAQGIDKLFAWAKRSKLWISANGSVDLPPDAPGYMTDIVQASVDEAQGTPDEVKAMVGKLLDASIEETFGKLLVAKDVDAQGGLSSLWREYQSTDESPANAEKLLKMMQKKDMKRLFRRMKSWEKFSAGARGLSDHIPGCGDLAALLSEASKNVMRDCSLVIATNVAVQSLCMVVRDQSEDVEAQSQLDLLSAGKTESEKTLAFGASLPSELKAALGTEIAAASARVG